MISREEQFRFWIRKHKQLIRETPNRNDRDYIIMMWQGYLTGMQMTNAITWEEYNDRYNELRQYVSDLESEQEGFAGKNGRRELLGS